MNATIQFTCPHCHKQMKLPSSTVGKQGKCPGCGQVVTISSGPTDDDGFLAMAFGTDDDVSDEVPMLLDMTSSSHVTNTGNSRTNNCSDCGGMVSVQVSTCPHCGAPTFSSDSTAGLLPFPNDELMGDPLQSVQPQLPGPTHGATKMVTALISCQHCGHKCAGQCRCPNCGGLSKPYSKGWTIFFAIALVVMLIGMGIGAVWLWGPQLFFISLFIISPLRN